MDEIDNAILTSKDKDVREICGRIRKSLKHIFDRTPSMRMTRKSRSGIRRWKASRRTTRAAAKAKCAR